MSIPCGRDYYCKGIVKKQMREGATMAKMYQVDKIAIVATMATMAFQLVSNSARVRISYQFESIKMGMSSKIVSEKTIFSGGCEINLNARQIRRAKNVQIPSKFHAANVPRQIDSKLVTNRLTQFFWNCVQFRGVTKMSKQMTGK